MPYNIEGVARGLRDAVDRGVLDREEVDAAVERWKAAEASSDEAWSSPMPEREEKIKAALAEYKDSTIEVTNLYLSAM